MNATDVEQLGKRTWQQVLNWNVLVLTCFVILVAFGVTTSSIGVPPLRDDPGADPAGLVAGEPRPIRSDDFLRTAPWNIGEYIGEGRMDFSPLAHADTAIVGPGASGRLTRFILVESSVAGLIGRVAPEQAYAFGWWLSVLVVLLLLPAWLRRLGVPRTVALPTTMLVVLAPATAWWSWSPTIVLAAALLPALGTVAAAQAMVDDGRHRWLRVVAWTALAVFGMGRLALSYMPWAVPIGLALLVPTLAFLLREQGRRRRHLGLVALVVVGGGLVAFGFSHEHAETFRILQDTVYPGARRSVGTMETLAQLFGAPHLWIMQETAPALVGTNQSELSSGYLVLALVGALLLPTIRWTPGGPGRATTIAGLSTIAALSTWCLVAWPDGAAKLFPMNLVVPDRLAQVIGLIGTIAFALAFSEWRRRHDGSRWMTASVAATITFFITAMAGSSLRETFLTTYRTPWIAAASLVTAVVVFVAIAFARRWWALMPMVVASVAVVALVHPLQQGFADIGDGDAAKDVRSQGRALGKDQYWASDDFYFDSLLMANAQPSISSQQWVGPDEDAWRELDPHDEYREIWNRGASFITFVWADEGEELGIDLPGADLIRVTADPCDPKLAGLGLALVSSLRRLEGDCLREQDQISFSGRPHFIYELKSGEST